VTPQAEIAFLIHADTVEQLNLGVKFILIESLKRHDTILADEL